MPLAFRSRWKETDDEEIESHSYANRNPIVIVYLMEQVASAEGMTEWTRSSRRQCPNLTDKTDNKLLSSL